jgi:hypothetical protein
MNTLTVIGCVLLFQLVAGLSIGIGSRYFKRKPYRVVCNGAGKFLVQHYQCVTPNWLECRNPDTGATWYRYDYVTLIECDTLEEATAHYREYMASYMEKEKAKRDKDAAERAAKRKKRLNERIVKVYEIPV